MQEFNSCIKMEESKRRIEKEIMATRSLDIPK